MKRITTSTSYLAIMTLIGSFGAIARGAELKTLSFNAAESHSLLTQQDFIRARVVERNGKVFLQVNLTDAASAKLKAYTSSHVGEKIAIISDGRLIAAPVIREPLGQRFEVDTLNRTEAEDLARLINHSE